MAGSILSILDFTAENNVREHAEEAALLGPSESETGGYSSQNLPGRAWQTAGGGLSPQGAVSI